MENLDIHVNELRKMPNETEWLEFKHDNFDPDMIGKDVSALANSAALREKSCAYMKSIFVRINSLRSSSYIKTHLHSGMHF